MIINLALGKDTSDRTHWLKTSDSPENGGEEVRDDVVRTPAENGTEEARGTSHTEAWGACQFWLCWDFGLERGKQLTARNVQERADELADGSKNARQGTKGAANVGETAESKASETVSGTAEVKTTAAGQAAEKAANESGKTATADNGETADDTTDNGEGKTDKCVAELGHGPGEELDEGLGVVVVVVVGADEIH